METFQQPLPIDVGVSLSGRENDYTVCMKNKQGTIVAPSNLNILPHEMATARALADVGMDVEFVSRTQGNRAKSADFIADGVLWEVVSPTSANLRVVQKHRRAALHQSRDVIFDCRRMKGAREEAVLKEVRKWAGSLASVRRLLFVDRSGGVLRIK